MKKITISTVCALALASSLFVGCGSSSSSDTPPPTPPSSNSTSGTLVDPYIVGAIMYQDTNGNKKYDDGELISSETNATGGFTFSKDLTVGKSIRIKTQGLHEGVTYDLDIAGVVADDKTIKVVSPLTTFESKGLTTTQIAALLNKTATEEGIHIDNDATKPIWTISASDISIDPISGGILEKKANELNQSDLVKIQASLSTYAILKIMNGSNTLKALSNTELYNSAMGLNGHHEVLDISKKMMKNIVGAVNTTFLNNIDTGLNNGRTALVNSGLTLTVANAALPKPPAKMVIKLGVSVIDKISSIGYSTCNATSGTETQKVTAALTAVDTFVSNYVSGGNMISLATQMYGIEYYETMKANLTTPYLNGMLGTVPDLQTGANLQKAGKVTIRMKDDGTFESH